MGLHDADAQRSWYVCEYADAWCVVRMYLNVLVCASFCFDVRVLASVLCACVCVCVDGIIRSVHDSSRKTDRTLDQAFADLDALMKHASDIVTHTPQHSNTIHTHHIINTHYNSRTHHNATETINTLTHQHMQHTTATQQHAYQHLLSRCKQQNIDMRSTWALEPAFTSCAPQN